MKAGRAGVRRDIDDAAPLPVHAHARELRERLDDRRGGVRLAGAGRALDTEGALAQPGRELTDPRHRIFGWADERADVMPHDSRGASPQQVVNRL